MSEFVTFAQSMPEFDAQYFLLLTSRVLHILGSIVMIGGVFYLLAVVAPKIAAGNYSADDWFSGNRAAWAKWVGISTAVLLVTGLFNFVMMVKLNHIDKTYHMLGTGKILIAFVLFFFAAILAGKTGLADRYRANMKKWLKVTFFVGLIIVILGAVMRSYPRTLKTDAGPALVAPDTN
jgi:uncharacterized membrane protein